MNRKERLHATLCGELVDRPAVSFYEINGLDEDQGTHNQAIDPYNIYSHPSWEPLIDLAREESDRIVMRSVPFSETNDHSMDEFTNKKEWEEGDHRFSRIEIKVGKRILSSTTRRDRDVNTIWQVEHLLKDIDDVKVWLSLPWHLEKRQPVIESILLVEKILGDTGIVMLDTADPLCLAASLFDLGTFTIIASTEPELFHRMLDIFLEKVLYETAAIAQALPGRLWRIYGPEYASPPYLSPKYFKEYVTDYDAAIVQVIQRYEGYARIHSHGRLKQIIDLIAMTGCDGLDPIEPPPQGDMELIDVRKRYGEQMVLFGNLEASDLENLPTEQFEKKIHRAINEGTYGRGRGFVLMPSSCPYGRKLNRQTLANYEKMIEIVKSFGE